MADTVRSGASTARMRLDPLDGRQLLCFEAEVHLEQNGDFVQAKLDLTQWGAPLDAGGFAGVRLIVRSNGEP
ncbi:CIA30 family protein [Thiocystis violacea]|uniref:CIA30 family protein n=1 Tax=Thiocystis violacea TaxID=13725 RepID=UPI001F5B58FB|nr:CIA30 family protein [Thiocystis violacea]